MRRALFWYLIAPCKAYTRARNAMILQACLEGAAKIPVGNPAEGRSFDFKNKLMPNAYMSAEDLLN